ncbi:hypothetical protein [Rheinheimera sp.]|uniref:hypothetical protein n=1 Tax=Rheinheimera sp. TaxID=1869214 RepID=UPI0027B8898F|nr:hypothetical protein [Rheinheimera sp.]
MSESEPQPLLVIRNQLLAFALLNLLGSCVHITDSSRAAAVIPEPTVVTTASQHKQPAVLSLNLSRQRPAR